MHIIKLLAGAAALAATAPAFSAGPPAPPVQLSVAFTEIEQKEGQIMVALFDSEAAWASGKPVKATMVKAGAACVTATFEGLAPGRYAVKSFHDIDGDGKMGANPFGIPTEPFAFSNNAKGAMGPATWADAAFEVAAGANAHRIVIR